MISTVKAKYDISRDVGHATSNEKFFLPYPASGGYYAFRPFPLFLSG